MSKSDSEMEVDGNGTSSNDNNKKSTYRIDFQDISKAISYITKSVELSQPRLIQRTIRQNGNLRKNVTKDFLREAVSIFVPTTCPTFPTMINSIEKFPNNSNNNEDKMAIDQYPTILATPLSILPEVEVFLFTLIITTLLRENLDAEAAYSSTILIERIRTFNRRSLDLLSSKAYFYFSLSYERIQRLENIRSTLLSLYRTTCIRHDEMGQAVLLNLLLRNYLHYNLITQAQSLSAKTSFPENASNNQFCRFLYYMGRIQAIQLEYSDSYHRLDAAARKAPQEGAKGFSVIIAKLSIIVKLLMGEIPQRTVFNTPEHRIALQPYLSLTQAVRAGDLQQFDRVVARVGSVFIADKNMTLVQRLSHNVLKTGLRKISLCYSRISLQEVADKLRLASAASAEYVCAKAIKEGVLAARLDHENGALLSADPLDVYSTNEPQKAFHKRIAFCLDVHNDAVKSMRYPSSEDRKELEPAQDKTAPDEKTIEELIRELEDDMDE